MYYDILWLNSGHYYSESKKELDTLVIVVKYPNHRKILIITITLFTIIILITMMIRIFDHNYTVYVYIWY